MDLLIFGSAHCGLTIGADKVITRQPASEYKRTVSSINVNGNRHVSVEKFAYLDSTLSQNTKIDGETAYWISKVSQAFNRLLNSGWSDHEI
nr:unnamed protein product [Spirometra erinaceieuropaei]